MSQFKITVTMSTPENEISECASICYATKPVSEGGKNITKTLVHSHNHLAALRFAYATVKIEDLSVAAQNQFVRSSHMDFMVQSKRYVNFDKGDFKFIMPEGLDEDSENAMKRSWDAAVIQYKHLLSIGCKKEDARAVLPANTSTSMFATANLQGWHSMFVLRINSHAQQEIRNIVLEIWNQFSEIFPQVFKDMKYDKKTLSEWNEYNS